MTRATLLALAERVEKAEGPDHVLDRDIVFAVRKSEFRPPAFTTSLDAALTLVPEGWGWQIRRSHTGQRTVCYLWSGSGVWSPTVVATTPALALTAAALRAKAEEMP